MAVKSITLLDGTTAYAHDVEDLVNPLYTDIDDTNIRLGADIQIKKLEDLTSAQIIVGSAANVPTAVAMTGDVSISNTGVTTVTGGAADEFAVTDDITTNATMYPVWVTANTGDLPAYVSSTKLYFNPSTGMLTATGFTGPLTGNATTASNLANGTYNYGSGAIIVNANNANYATTAGSATTATTASNLANGTYNYGSGAIIVNANTANSASTASSATTATYAVYADSTAKKPTVDQFLTGSSLCKMWVKFDLNGSGAISIADFYNVPTSGVTLQGTGSADYRYRIEFDTNLASVNYAVSACATFLSGVTICPSIYATNVGYVEVRFEDYSGNGGSGPATPWINRTITVCVFGII